jgi:hypothetical protein
MTDHEPMNGLTMFWYSVAMVCLLILLRVMSGCTAAQLQVLEDGFVSLGDCAVVSSLGCAAQSMGGCPPPLSLWGGEEWSGYGECLAEKSMSCASMAMAKCAYRSIVDAIDGPVVTGSSGCNNPQELAKIKKCVCETTIETEADAVQAVAYCQRLICMGAED